MRGLSVRNPLFSSWWKGTSGGFRQLEALADMRSLPTGKLFDALGHPPSKVRMRRQWQPLQGMQMHWRRDRDVRDGWTFAGQPRAAAQALVENACKLMESFFFPGQHGRIGGPA